MARDLLVENNAIIRVQAAFRGQRSRKLHVERVKKNLAWAPYIPCDLKAANAMLKIAQVSPSDTILDIGCGDGRIVIMASEAPYSAKRALGVDIDSALIAQCQNRASTTGNKRVEFICDDWINLDLSHVSVITLFFLPHESIARILQQKCQPGTRVVTYVFEIPEWEAETVATTVPFLKQHGESPLFLYKV